MQAVLRSMAIHLFFEDLVVENHLSGDLCINHGANFICEDVAYIKDEDNFSIEYAPNFIKLSDEISGLLKLDSAKKMKLVSDRLERSIYKINQNLNINNLKACFSLSGKQYFSITKNERFRNFAIFLLTTFTSFSI